MSPHAPDPPQGGPALPHSLDAPHFLSGRRLRHQKLSSTDLKHPAEVVAWLGAVQSQDYAGATWAVAQRAKGMTQADVDRAFDAGTILRTHVLRPTWHFVAPADLRWMQALTGPRVRAMSASVLRTLEIDTATTTRVLDVFAHSLAGGCFLTRAELAHRLAAAGIHATGLRLAYLVMLAELDAVICSGPRRGRQFTYALVDERAPRAPAIGVDEALARLAARYFTSHGPATLRDFVWWSGLTVGQARRAIAAARPALLEDAIGDLTYRRTATRAIAPKPDAAFLLPNYDEYLIAYQDRGILGAASRARSTSDVPLDIFAHFLVVGGLLAGTWRRTIRTRDAIVTVTPHWRLTTRERGAVEAAVKRYGRFIGLPVALRWA